METGLTYLTKILAFTQTPQQSTLLFLLNHCLQALFFSLTVCYLASMFLKVIHFSYAETLAENKLVKFSGLVLFYYLKIWDYYSGLLYILSIFAMAMVSVYVYDCCGNISQSCNDWKENHRQFALIGSFTLMLSSTYLLIYSMFKNVEKPLEYQFMGIYLSIIILILVGNYLRGRSIIYTLVGVLIMNYLVWARYYFEIKDNYSIPFFAIPYIMMALDAENKERSTLGGAGYLTLFKTCCAFATFAIISHPTFPLELVLGFIFIFAIIINR